MSTQREAVITTQDKTKELVIDALFIALTFAATMFINIRLPLMGNGGLIHLGNVPMFLGAFIFGKRTGALAAASHGAVRSDFGLDGMGAVYAGHRRTDGLCIGTDFRKIEGTPDHRQYCRGHRGAHH